MKNFASNAVRFAFFSALVCLAFTAQAQTPAAAQSALTEQERADAIRYLDDTRKKFLDSIKGLSEAQWKYKSAPDRWSVAEVAEHIALSEDLIFGLASKQIMSSPAAPEKKEAEEGIATNILAERLQRLEATGILLKQPDPADGRKTIYQLTPKGIDLAPVLVEMILWSARHEKTEAPPATIRAIRKNREGFIAEVRQALGETSKRPR